MPTINGVHRRPYVKHGNICVVLAMDLQNVRALATERHMMVETSVRVQSDAGVTQFFPRPENRLRQPRAGRIGIPASAT